MIDSTCSLHQNEQQLIAGIERWSKALENKDIDAMLDRCADDIIAFDCKMPMQHKGVSSLRAMWESCLPYFPEQFKSDRHDLVLKVDGNLAFMHCLHRVVSTIDGAKHPGPWLRVTVCYEKIEGEWRVVHEHVSAPFDPETGQAVFAIEEISKL